MNTSTRDLFLKVTAEGGPQLNKIFEDLKAIGGTSKATAKDIGTFEQALKAGVISTREFNAALEAVARNEKRAADEIQRSGRMMEAAAAEDRKRTAAIQARTRALEQAAVAEGKAAQAQSLASARGFSSIASLTGMATPGISQGVTGVSGLVGGGLSSAALAATAGVGAFVALAGAIIKAANSLGDYAREQQNVSARTGLSVTETQLFGRVAEVAGVNAGTLTTSMRTLSKAMAENSQEGRIGKKALAELGLDSSIAFEGTETAIRKIFTALGNVNNSLERDRLAIALFGRGALELAPLFGQFEQLSAQVKATGVIIDEEGIQKAADYRREAALLGEEWDSVVNKFKQKAVGVVSFIIDAPDAEPLDQAAKAAKALADATVVAGRFALGGIGGNLFAEYIGHRLGNKGGPGLPGSPVRSGASIEAEQSANALKSIKDSVGTPKDRINEKLKGVQDAITAAEASFSNTVLGSPDNVKAGNTIRSKSQEQTDLRAQLDALKDGKRASEETLRLREQLIAAGARQLSGIVKINAEYDKEVQHLKDKKEATPANLALAAQVRDVNIATFRQHAALSATEDARHVRDAVLEVQQQGVRAKTGRQAQATRQEFTLAGDEQGGIDASYTQRVKSAHEEYDLAKQRADVNRMDAAQEFAQKTDSIAFGKALRAAEIVDIHAKGQLETELANAEQERIIATAALKQKDRKEAEQAIAEEIKNAQILSDLTLKRSRIIAEGQTRLSVAKAAPGFELQAELNADAQRLALDRQQSILNQNRLAVNITTLEAEKPTDPNRKREIEKDLSHLRIEAAREAAQIENDTINARFDAEVRIAQKRKADELAFRSTVVGYLNAAQQGHGQDFLRGVGQGLLNTIEGNVAGLAFPKVDAFASSIGQKLSGTADKPSFVGKLLAGTPFGPQEKNPINSNTTALDVNTRSLDTLTQTVGAIATGGALPSGTSVLGGAGNLASSASFAGASSPFGPLSGSDASTLASVITQLGGNTGSTNSSVPLSFPFSTEANRPSATEQILGGGSSSARTSGSSGMAGTVEGPLFDPNASTSAKIGSAVATAGVVYTGVTTAMKQFSKGGAYGVVGGIGTIAGTAAALDPEPISKAILTGVALGSKVITAIMGDPRQHRQDQINMELAHNVYQAPTTQNRTQDIYGNYTDFDKYGKLQTSDFSAIPQVTEPYTTKRNGQYFNVPGQVTSPFGGTAAPVVINNNFSSIDPAGAMNYFKSNPDLANAVIHVGLTQAHGPAQSAVRETAGLS